MSEKARDAIDSFLMIGQSNMAGRGIIGTVPPIDPRGMLFMLRNGRWQPMTEPINPDRRIYVSSEKELRSGVCLAASFADEYEKCYHRRIGLIPCADGGTNILQWQPGEVLFDHAVMQTRLAQRSSRVCGILWHQGESECRDMENVRAYPERFFRMLDTMLSELALDADIPVVIGELCEDRADRWPLVREMNETLRRVAASRPNIAIASCAGFTLSPDTIHFSAASYREFGRRYFACYREIRGGK